MAVDKSEFQAQHWGNLSILSVTENRPPQKLSPEGRKPFPDVSRCNTPKEVQSQQKLKHHLGRQGQA